MPFEEEAEKFSTVLFETAEAKFKRSRKYPLASPSLGGVNCMQSV
jgi:hypothetical protein